MVSNFDEKKLRRTFRRFYLPPRCLHQEGEQLVAYLDQNLIHHIRNVLRIGAGAQIALFDNSGKEYLGEIIFSKPSQVKVKILETKFPPTESPLELILAQALVKQNAFDKILTSATELGVKKIIPIITKRTVVKIRPQELDSKMIRWRRILEESAGLSGRVKVPEIQYPIELSQLLKEPVEAIKILLWEKAQGGELKSLKLSPQNQPQKISPPEKTRILLLAGPEGGFEDQEAEATISVGFLPLGLGPRILRAETAPISALSILQYLFGDLS